MTNPERPGQPGSPARSGWSSSSGSPGSSGSSGSPGSGVRLSALVVEDEENIVALIRLYLEREGYRVEAYADGAEALDAVARLRPSVIVLDIGVPGLDGMEVCRRLRAAGDWTPVLFVTARDEEVDRVVGLELGADDYVTKPFSPRELVARVKAIVRRGTLPSLAAPDPAADPVAGAERPERAEPPVLSVGSVRLDPGRRLVWADGEPVQLTATEFDLLAHLMRRPGRVFEREQLLADVWGYADATSRTVDVHVAQLRAKLGAASPIRTVRGVGYAADAR